MRMLDAGLRGRTVACQTMRPQVGGDTPRTNTIRGPAKLPPRPMGHGILQPGGVDESLLAQSQSEAAAHTMTVALMDQAR